MLHVNLHIHALPVRVYRYYLKPEAEATSQLMKAGVLVNSGGGCGTATRAHGQLDSARAVHIVQDLAFENLELNASKCPASSCVLKLAFARGWPIAGWSH
jgi:hypothetical protein